MIGLNDIFRGEGNKVEETKLSRVLIGSFTGCLLVGPQQMLFFYQLSGEKKHGSTVDLWFCVSEKEVETSVAHIQLFYTIGCAVSDFPLKLSRHLVIFAGFLFVSDVSDLGLSSDEFDKRP